MVGNASTCVNPSRSTNPNASVAAVAKLRRSRSGPGVLPLACIVRVVQASTNLIAVETQLHGDAILVIYGTSLRCFTPVSLSNYHARRFCESRRPKPWPRGGMMLRLGLVVSMLVVA